MTLLEWDVYVDCLEFSLNVTLLLLALVQLQRLLLLYEGQKNIDN